MDLCKEQLVVIKQTKRVLLSKIVIWFFASVLALISLYLTIKFPPALLVFAGILYLAYKATAKFNIEYEYIAINGSVDIDKIINKTSRKNVVSFECKEVEGVAKYSHSVTYKNKLLVCTDDFENAYVFTITSNGIKYDLVFSPNEKLLDSFKIYIPRSVISKR